MLGASLVGSQLSQRVLDHAEACIGSAKLGTDRSNLGHRDAAIVDREDSLRLLDLLCDLSDRFNFLFFVHEPPNPDLWPSSRPAGGLGWREYSGCQAAAGAAS